MKVFLSHSSVDKSLARRLARDLMSANIDVWLDQWEIRVGEAFVQVIEQGVDEAEFVIVLLTRAGVASEWVNREWRRKFDSEARTRRIAVLPVIGEPCEIPNFLAHRSHVDISGGSYPPGFRHLLEILRYHADQADFQAPEKMAGTQAPPPNLLPIVTPIGLEVSRDLFPLFEQGGRAGGRFLNELAPRLRESLEAEFGFTFPGLRIRGNESDMPPGSALILIDEIPEAMIRVGLDDVLVDGTVAQLAGLGIHGESREDPAAGRALARIASSDRGAVEAAGLAAWDAAEYLMLALQAVIRRMAPLFIDIDVTQRLVDSLAQTAPELAAATVPKTVSWYELTEVLQHLVAEGIGIGDMGRILSALRQRKPEQHGTVLLAEQVRHALRDQITAKFARGRDALPVLRMDPGIEARISRAIQRTPLGPYLSLAPELTREILAALRGVVDSLVPGVAGAPILVATVEIRSFIRRLVKLEFPRLHVVSQQDIGPDTQVRTIAWIRLQDDSRNGMPEKRGGP